MDGGEKQEISSITEDLRSMSTPVIYIDDHNQSPSSTLPSSSAGRTKEPSGPSILNPSILKSDRWSVETSAEEDEHRVIPPSPTLIVPPPSSHLISTSLRERSSEISGSLALYSPNDDFPSNYRRPPGATITNTDDPAIRVDHSHSHAIASVRFPAWSTLSTPTSTRASSVINPYDSAKRKKAHEVKGDAGRAPEKDDSESEQVRPDLTQDEHVDPTPFAFKPYHLASLVDPKNLEALEAMGGIEGLLAGLGTDPTSGLRVSGKKLKPGDTPSANSPANEEFTHEGSAYAGTVEDRKRVYGSNVLPVLKSKSLLEFMRLALKDKVLVRLPSRNPLNPPPMLTAP